MMVSCMIITTFPYTNPRTPNTYAYPYFLPSRLLLYCYCNVGSPVQRMYVNPFLHVAMVVIVMATLACILLPPFVMHTDKEPWANLLALINDKSTADLDIKAKAMSLINRVRLIRMRYD